MVTLRQLLRPIVFAWLLCHVGTVAAVPVGIWHLSSEAEECTCSHAGHAICPMHHRSAPARCAMRGATNADTAVLGSLLQGLGVLPQSQGVAAPTPLVVSERVAHDGVTSRHTPPDGPPPRA